MNLAVLSAGMLTSVGFNAPASCAAIQAGIEGIGEIYLTEYIGSADNLYAGKVELPHWWDSLERLADLVAPAINESLSFVSENEKVNVPLLLGTALPNVEVLGDVFAGNLLGMIETKLALPHHPKSEIFPYGHTSGAHALIKAQKLLRSSSIKYCVIAGTDSYLQRVTVDYYIAQRRIMTRDNSNGFIPGEAGVATLIGVGENFPSANVHIIGLGKGNEPATITSQEPFSAEGMTQALRQMQNESGISLSQIQTSLSDLNGEYYKSNEINLAVSRFSSALHPIDITNISHPIENIGEIGAAILPCLLNISLLTAEKSYSKKDEYVLIHISNDDTERVAITLKVNS